jgi:hypothetical protein
MRFYREIDFLLESVKTVSQLEDKFSDEPSVERFISTLVDLCKKHDIKLKLEDKEKVDSGDHLLCNGYFDETTKELVVGTKNPLNLWLRVLVHESCHLDQYLYFPKSYNACVENVQKLNDYLQNPVGELEDKEEILRSVLKLELDCEKRSVEKIDAYKLPIDKETYIKEANEYLFSYEKSLRTKKWDDGSKKFDHKLRDSMPSHFLSIASYMS